MTQQAVTLLTGGAGILGSRMAARLIAEGHVLVVVDRNQEALEKLAADLGPSESFRGLAADVASRTDMEAVRDEIEAELGAVSTLINAAAGKSENFFEPFEEFPIGDWDEVMRINLTSAMVCSQVFGKGMAERGAGNIVNILSIYGIVAPDQRIYEGSEYLGRAINTPAVYSASKAGLWGLTKYLAAYWGHRNVRVNAVTPGGVFSGQNETFVERYSARVPLGRMAEPFEIADAVAFLASDRSAYISGQNIVVDGGLSTW
ncbi:SDR family oxidoreductase [Microbacterium sediminis]|uniref:Short-chain dehydrogenase n=1 Tax=Microbacterium sediminis TaxID=904291 RepID=A0A1B9NDL3_9MICO|nr:SDR family oxidoreductase [Microbacterium sediminis]OCG74687.1 short-chain dehydrogenase [Microbacterium sediminis]QBR74983.1 SDR family oxidoreductase [Microbacterium sediminis]